MKFEYHLDHLGIAVTDLESGKKFYEALGLGPMEVEIVESEKVKTGSFELKNGANIELLEPIGTDGPVSKFLSKRGPGLHHICLRVNDIYAAVKSLKEKGVKLINEEPKRGAHNCLVAFIHPSSAGGLLVELSQPAMDHGGQG